MYPHADFRAKWYFEITFSAQTRFATTATRTIRARYRLRHEVCRNFINLQFSGPQMWRQSGATARDLSAATTKPRKYCRVVSASTLRSPGIARGLVCQRRPACATCVCIRVHIRVSRWARLAILTSCVFDGWKYNALSTLGYIVGRASRRGQTVTRPHSAPVAHTRTANGERGLEF